MKYRRGHFPRFDEATATLAAKDVAVSVAVLVRRFADKERRIFQRKIESQRFPSFKEEPLAASTLEKKRRYGRSLRVLMATKQYVDSVAVQERLRGRSRQFFIGQPPGKPALDIRTGHQRRGVTLQQLALWHERGTKHPWAPSPARPHWAVQQEAMAKRTRAIREEARRMALSIIRRRIGV